jgi:hypothetical protein
MQSSETPGPRQYSDGPGAVLSADDHNRCNNEAVYRPDVRRRLPW